MFQRPSVLVGLVQAGDVGQGALVTAVNTVLIARKGAVHQPAQRIAVTAFDWILLKKAASSSYGRLPAFEYTLAVLGRRQLLEVRLSAVVAGSQAHQFGRRMVGIANIAVAACFVDAYL